MTATTTKRGRPALTMKPAQFDGLHEAVVKARWHTQEVRVDKAALAALLQDYAALLELHRINPGA